jgi:hypothetical protein
MAKPGLIRRAAAGGPILYGYWASIVSLFLSGVCADNVEAIDRLTSTTGNYLVWWWPYDAAWAAASFTFGVIGTLCLNGYGRACWATPPGDNWNGLPVEQIRRTPLIRRPRWLLWKS